MDFERVVTRVSGLCALVYALVNPVALWLLLRETPATEAALTNLVVGH